MKEVKLSELDTKFKYDIASQPGAENFKRCFTCGTCTAACPVAEVNEDYDPRKIIRMAILGMRKEVLSSDIIWMCQRCYVCYARCPQNVKFADVMSILRDMAVKEGYAPKDRLAKMDDLDRFVQDLRCNMVTYLLKPGKKQDEKIKSMVNKKLKSLDK
jgi:heterodisulfide reductase subunit C